MNAVINVQELPVDKVMPGLRWQARDQEVTPGSVQELAASIRAVGLIEPIVVRVSMTGDNYEVVAGHRRRVAVELAGLPTITARVLPANTSDAALAAIAWAENAERLGLTPLEEAAAVQEAVSLSGSIEQAALVLGKPETWVALRAKLIDLTEAWRQELEKNVTLRAHLSVAHLEIIAKLPEDVQEEMRMSLRWTIPGTVADLRRMVEQRLGRLEKAPWNVAEFTHVESVRASSEVIPPCLRCPKQTGHQALLFGEFAEDARCLDKACWGRRMEAHIGATVAAAEAKGKPLVRLRRDAHLLGKGEVALNQVNRKKVEGWTKRRGIVLDDYDAGKVISFYEPPPGSKEARARQVGGGAQEKPTVTREERVERRRAKRITELLAVRLGSEWATYDPEQDEIEPTVAGVPLPDLPKLNDIVHLASMFGTEFADRYAYQEQRSVDSVRQRWTPAKDVEEAGIALWRRVAPVLRKRTAWTSPADHMPVLTECRLLCEFLGWSYGELVQRAMDEIPDPKVR